MMQDSTGNARVDHNHKYMVIDKNSPRNQKCILINKPSGVAFLGAINAESEKFATHWAPLPTFEGNKC